jgi:uncharacterized membrane protein
MKRGPIGYWPLGAPFLIALIVLALLAVGFVEVNVISYAYQKIGLDRAVAPSPMYAAPSGPCWVLTSQMSGGYATLGAPLVSIGGAGTFDGIFLTGILAVILAGMTAHDLAARCV